jgi:hypothetical protein
MIHLVGALSSQFSSFTIIPSHSFAVVVLMAGKEKAMDLHRIVLDHFLPAFDKALIAATKDHIAGKWTSSDDRIDLHIIVSDGVLYATRYLINGTDALASLNNGKKTNRVPIWSVGNNEYRYVYN